MNKYEDEDFRTPQDFFEGVQNLVGNFDLDVAASAQNAKCKNFFTRQQNGLLRDWFGNVWCNPPYSKVKPWFEKAIRELDENRCHKVAILVNQVDSSTRWFHDYVLERAAAIYFVKGRLDFTGPYSLTNSISPRASMLIILTKRAFRTHHRVFAGMDRQGRVIQNQTSLSEF